MAAKLKKLQVLQMAAFCGIATSVPIQNFGENKEISFAEWLNSDTPQKEDGSSEEGVLPSFFPESQSSKEAKAHQLPPEPSSIFQIGGNYTHVHIKPKNTHGFHGNMGGAQAMYEYRPLNSFYAALKGMWRQGDTTGDGEKRHLLDIDVQERVGYTFACESRKYLLALFTGFGYRYLSHKLTADHSVMKLHYDEFYVPVGFLADWKVNAPFSIGLNFIWMPQVDSTVHLEPIGGSRWILKRELANFLVELPLTFSMGTTRQFLIILKPFYEYWRDGHSTAKTTTAVPLGLPGNTYNFWGAEFNFGYKF